MRSHFALLILFTAVLVSTSLAQEVPIPVTANLLSNIQTVKPGDSFKIGVLLEIDPGWHVYWKYPGKTGLPTKVNFTAPQGYQVGEVMWPIPSTYQKLQGELDYGYSNSVLLWTDIEVPLSLNDNGSGNIEIQVSWLSCKEICIPGNQSFSYELEVGKETLRAEEGVFSKWDNSLPLIDTTQDNPFEVKVVTKQAKSDLVSVIIAAKYKENKGIISYYPNPGNTLVVKNLRSDNSGKSGTTEISFEVAVSDEVVVKDNFLDGLIVYSDNQGKKSAVELKINLDDT